MREQASERARAFANKASLNDRGSRYNRTIFRVEIETYTQTQKRDTSAAIAGQVGLGFVSVIWPADVALLCVF